MTGRIIIWLLEAGTWIQKGQKRRGRECGSGQSYLSYMSLPENWVWRSGNGWKFYWPGCVCSFFSIYKKLRWIFGPFAIIMGDNGPVQCGTGKAFGRGRKHMYEYDSRVRLTEVGQDRRMTLTAILNAFQDCSTFHSVKLYFLNLHLQWKVEQKSRVPMKLSKMFFS